MTDIRPGSNTQDQFFSARNEGMLERLLNADFERRIGGELNDKQRVRLEKTVRHYMTEVYAKNPTQPVQYLNREVLTAVVPDYMSYIKRSAGPTVAEDTAEAAGSSSLFTDVTTRFDRLQAERQGQVAAIPPAPDFRLSLDDSGPSPLSRFEEIKRMREAEAAREAETAAAMAAAAASTAPGGTPLSTSQDLVIVPTSTAMSRFIDSDVDFRSSAAQAKARDQLALVMREEERAAAAVANRTTITVATLPDPRRILLGEKATVPLPARVQGIASANPTTAVADSYRERGPLPQDILRKEDDILAYKETEHNLFVYSADRDWVNNNTENRYNFSVNFDPANNRPGFGYSPATNIRFKNITRIEFVKAILPVESCDILPKVVSGNVDTSLSVNTLSFPYLQVRIPELNTNGYGTSDGMNNAFAAISYDAYWTGDTNAANKGYTRLIPKFLKCQKVYHPTPLATLQKLTFEIQRPDGTLFCSSKDTLDIGAVYMPGATGSDYDGGGWIWLNTSAYFSRFMVAQGDRIQIKNVSLNASLAANPNAQTLIQFLTRAEGHLVSNIGVLSGGVYSDGPNTAGYANGIIIRNDYEDPTTGSTSLKAWATAIQATLNANPTLTAGRLINLNHQVQIILRVITRDMDPSARLRPDNLQA